MEKVFKLRLTVNAAAGFSGGKLGYECPVCVEQRWANAAYTPIHMDEPKHRQSMKECEMSANEFLCRSRSVHHLLGQLKGNCDKVDPIYVQILAYLYRDLDQQCPVPKLVDLEAQVKAKRWNMVLVVLELMLWKAACILNHSQGFSNATSFLIWMSEGWKVNKAAMRRNELITVVMENVKSFLDKL